MGERTSYKHGVPSWVDLATTDVAAAKEFYGKLFGWSFDDVPTNQGVPYTMFKLNGMDVAGAGPTWSPEMPPVWNSYINVDDVDSAAARVTENGGTLTMEPADMMDSGRMAFATDPTGATFGLWQAKDHKGARIVNDPGSFCWNELITDDVAAAQKFYSNVLGWGAEAAETQSGGTYTSFTVGEAGIAGMMEKRPEWGPIPNYWGVYFTVENVDDSVSLAQELGGKVVAEAFDLPGMGRMAVLQDPQGAGFSIWEAPAEAV